MQMYFYFFYFHHMQGHYLLRVIGVRGREGFSATYCCKTYQEQVHNSFAIFIPFFLVIRKPFFENGSFVG